MLVFRRSARLASGHVSVVSRVVSAREILVTQANWVPRRVTREPVFDVSPGNDWSAVRVWWAPSRASTFAMARPMPREAPVTSATFPARGRSQSTSGASGPVPTRMTCAST